MTRLDTGLRRFLRDLFPELAYRHPKESSRGSIIVAAEVGGNEKKSFERSD